MYFPRRHITRNFALTSPPCCKIAIRRPVMPRSFVIWQRSRVGQWERATHARCRSFAHPSRPIASRRWVWNRSREIVHFGRVVSASDARYFRWFTYDYAVCSRVSCVSFFILCVPDYEACYSLSQISLKWIGNTFFFVSFWIRIRHYFVARKTIVSRYLIFECCHAKSIIFSHWYQWSLSLLMMIRINYWFSC